MSAELRCFHSDSPQVDAMDRLMEGRVEQAVVVCVHVFGLGLYLPGVDAFGHVNVPVMGVEVTRTLDDYPAVGARLSVKVLGYTAQQLRLAVAD